MTRHIGRSLIALPLLLGVVGIMAGGAARAAGGTVIVLPATGVVDNVLAAYLQEGIAVAARDGASAVVIRLNTPGGSLDATQKIVSALLGAPLPTIVWVAPSGARAASAGTFITLAGHVAVMASGTNIGAASPISGSGEDIGGTLGKKILNDAIANIRSIAEKRGRNVAWAEETVRDARSSAASEAVALGAVDGIADDIGAVLAFADGRTVTVTGQSQTLALAGTTPEELPMNPLQEFLHLLSDPNIAFILFTIGFYGLLFELQSPNFVTGILGALAIILAFIGFGSLPLNIGGLLLILLAMVLFGLEFSVTSHGLLGAGGLLCFALGASALFTQPGDPFQPLASVAAPVILTTTVTAGLFLALVVWAAVRSRGMASPAGIAGSSHALPLGTAGVVRLAIQPLGSVYAAGEEWSARTADGRSLERGVPVRVISIDGLTVIVEPDPSSSTESLIERRS
ncbi:MAG: nodulation protein NfeD [Chloroflexi bacterium]|nr:nodulation protein NfeD [Chloroflexota bacterium]